MRSVLLPLASVAMLSALPAQAQERVLLDITGFRGTCETLKTPQTDLSSKCHQAVMSLHYDDGRRNFSFFSGEPGSQTIFAFSGLPDLSLAGEDDSVSMAVDQVFTGTSAEITPVVVSGECRFTWPFAGTVTIRCEARSDGGTFTAHFVSNGEAPSVTPLH